MKLRGQVEISSHLGPCNSQEDVLALQILSLPQGAMKKYLNCSVIAFHILEVSLIINDTYKHSHRRNVSGKPVYLDSYHIPGIPRVRDV